MKKNYEFDASQYVIGRLATEIAKILQGKNDPSYAPNKSPQVKVTVYNSDKLNFTGKKGEQKEYKRHSGYPGHLFSRTLNEQMQQDSTEVVKKAVYNMLPKNKLRYQMMKNLIVVKAEAK
jgi:large subunit ribosomal protein L13